MKITSGLLDYQIYLEFVTNNVQDDKKDKARVIQSATKTLNQILKQEVSASHSLMQCGEGTGECTLPHLKAAAASTDSLGRRRV